MKGKVHLVSVFQMVGPKAAGGKFL